jgi:hypothetical protein
MIEAPHAEAYLAADRVHRGVGRLQDRLDHVHEKGGAYDAVQMSEHVGALLARLEAGAALSSFVH